MRMRVSRTLAAGVSLALGVGACGGSMNETEYVEGLNDLVVTAGAELEASFAAHAEIADPTLADLVARLDRELATEYTVREKFRALDPPDSIADVHQVMVDSLVRIIAVAEDLADVADSVSSLEAAEQTREFANYLAVNADVDSLCLDVQDKINDLADGGGFGAGPWVVDLRLTVQVFLDCDEAGLG